MRIVKKIIGKKKVIICQALYVAHWYPHTWMHACTVSGTRLYAVQHSFPLSTPDYYYYIYCRVPVVVSKKIVTDYYEGLINRKESMNHVYPAKQ